MIGAPHAPWSEGIDPMQRLLRGPIAGALTLGTIALSSLILFVFFVPIALVKLILPVPALQRRCTAMLLGIVDVWVAVISFLFRRISGVHMDVRGVESVNRGESYLLIANHQTWADIAVLAYALHRRIPFPRFFIKHELIWFPIIGFVCWALDFPFMKRYSKETIARRPHLKDADLVTMRRACEKYRHLPATVANFAEGTRSTAAKRAHTRSPYRHLMRPKSTGAAFMARAMADILSGIIDVTIAYPDAAEPTLWDYACGRLPMVRVRVSVLPLPSHLLRGDHNDPAARHAFQAWMNELWRDKDELLDHLLAEPSPAHCRASARKPADAA